MTAKLRFALLLLVLIAPAVVGASPASQSSAGLLEGLSPLDGAQSTTCSSLDCAAQCDPCPWKFYGCVNGEAICACRAC